MLCGELPYLVQRASDSIAAAVINLRKLLQYQTYRKLLDICFSGAKENYRWVWMCNTDKDWRVLIICL